MCEYYHEFMILKCNIVITVTLQTLILQQIISKCGGYSRNCNIIVETSKIIKTFMLRLQLRSPWSIFSFDSPAVNLVG